MEPVREQAAAIIKVHGEISPTALTALTYTAEIQQEKSVTYDGAQALMAYFEQKGYITKSGKIKDSMKTALQSGTLDLPPQFEGARAQLESAIRRADIKPPIRDASRDVPVTLKKEVLVSPEFLELWDIVTTVEKRYKGHHQRKRQREGFFSKSASAKPRNVR